MCVNISVTDGLLSITRASRPRFGRARSRLTRMVLLRSQESRRASSKRWFGTSGISTLRFADAKSVALFFVKTNNTNSLGNPYYVTQFRAPVVSGNFPATERRDKKPDNHKR